jgi:acetyl esterase/lipase
VVVTAEYDDLRTTGEAFVELLRAAGVDVRHVQADGMLHGFLNLSPTLEPVDAVLDLMSELVATSTTLAPMEN